MGEYTLRLRSAQHPFGGPLVQGYMTGLLGELFRERSFKAKVQFGDKFIPYPMKGWTS